MRKIVILSLLAALMLMLAACGGSGSSTNTSETGGTDSTDVVGEDAPETEAESEVEPEAMEPMDVNVVGLDIKYEPTEFTVKAGQPVNITLDNQGALEHNITWTESDELFLTTMGGESATGERTFDTAGEYGFYCSVAGHKEAGMVGTVVVE